METLYKPVFMFSKEISNFRKEIAKSQFVMARKIAVEELNPKYEEWNNNFETTEIPEDDELKDYGGTKYCKYIQKKIRGVLKQVNKKIITIGWELDADEIGDIIFRHKHDKDLIMTLELIPVNIK